MNVADLILGLYLCALIVIYYVYEGQAAFVAMIWKQTTWCRIIMSLFMMSILLSNISTLVIGLDRFVTFVLCPFEMKRTNKYTLLVVMIFGWFIGILLPVIAGIFSHSSISNTACIMVGRSLSVHFAILYACLNIALFLCMILIYTMIIHNVKSSSAQITRTKQYSLHAVLRLGSVILTNFLASFTITIMAFMSVAQHNISDNVEILLSFIVFPINSCINPIINTL